MPNLAGLLRRTEFLSGLFILILGGVCHLAVGDLEIGTAQEMGPGYVPLALAWLILLTGAAMTFGGLWDGREVQEAVHWRPLVAISGAVVIFGLLVDRYGIVLAVVAATLVASFASPITRHRETPALCAVLALFGALAFVKGLGLAIPIWPR
ncbi:tripartite tricarboxylate transporter TctB family protein [Aquabacter spiritensis]|uniref:Tripartite tricarboxylate transporter TctB family protein n=1 Tax=Aquabacter spiritensis TaxID=933073 RepID=A0A4R3M474_9HYPH|nr:tripartite tricarboxylate transporter TctB family protein [Aquabacter spiritensis]TCT06147.1 tripartite tricarboxylate transporter TctB family protein [Aquabacter spiritensis]